MRITRVKIKNFRSLKSLEIELGRINVFIGENGAGKTSILETIGVISAVMSNGFTDEQLKQRGVRLGVPSLIKSSFANVNYPTSIEMGLDWSVDENKYQYRLNVNAPNERNAPWKVFSESFKVGTKTVFGRSNRSRTFSEYDGISVDATKSMYSVLRKVSTPSIKQTHIDWENVDILDQIEDYGIYCPNTLMLRGLVTDTVQKIPVGLYGGRLPDAILETIRSVRENPTKRKLFDRFFALNDWVENISIGLPTGNLVSPSVPTPNRILRITDKYMNKARNILTAYDANEGVLYTFFLACIALHPNAPAVCAIDNFDYGMNPRLAREATHIFCDAIKDTDRTILLTTHNPLVLDGLDLNNDDIRLFAVSRNRSGHTVVNRISVEQSILDNNETLSSLWLSGRLGGMPNI